jgi:hypothetical protein
MWFSALIWIEVAFERLNQNSIDFHGIFLAVNRLTHFWMHTLWKKRDDYLAHLFIYSLRALNATLGYCLIKGIIQVGWALYADFDCPSKIWKRLRRLIQIAARRLYALCGDLFIFLVYRIV